VLGWLREWSGLPANWFGLIYDTAPTGATTPRPGSPS
jgi:hypothetical protein